MEKVCRGTLVEKGWTRPKEKTEQNEKTTNIKQENMAAGGACSSFGGGGWVRFVYLSVYVVYMCMLNVNGGNWTR